MTTKKTASKAKAEKATPVKAGGNNAAATPAKKTTAPAKTPRPQVKPAQKTSEGKATTAKVKPVPKATAATREAVKKPRNPAKPLPQKGEGKATAAIVASAEKAAKKITAKKQMSLKAVIGVAKTITVDQLINFAKSDKSLNQGGKFVQILQFESNRKSFTVKLNAPVKVNGELVSVVKLNNSDILLLDAEAAKVFRHIDVANVTLKFKRV